MPQDFSYIFSLGTIPSLILKMLGAIGEIFSVWWWIFPPFILLPLFLRAWLWWRRELWESNQKYTLLEIIPPREVLKPFSSMEYVFTTLWSLHSSTEGIRNFRKKWLMGKRCMYFSIEIAGIGPTPHFFLRINSEHLGSVRAAFYSQYPDMGFREVTESYDKGVSWDIPDEKWDMYGMDIVPVKSDIYPIRTYSQFFETRPDSKEEKRIDPINTLLEGINELKDDEQLWIQMRVEPVTGRESDYMERGRKLINKLVYRTGSKGRMPNEGGIPPEMKLTPRERDVVKLIEDKIGKYVFKTNIRCLYLGRRGVFNSGRKALAEQYFAGFSAPDINMLMKWRKTKTKILHFLIKRRLYLRKKRIFRRYILRETALYPRRSPEFILSTEELATIFHIPVAAGSIGASMEKAESKKSSHPIDLPV